MYTIVEQPPQFGKALEECAALLDKILSAVPPSSEAVQIDASQVVFPEVETRMLYVLREGVLTYHRSGRLLFYFEPGDLVGLENHFCTTDIEIRSDFAVVVDEYDSRYFFDAVAKDSDLQATWNKYLAHQLNLLTMILSSLVGEEANPEIRSFTVGELIIREGDSATEVYTMLEGHADVYVKDVKVGEILRDEIFGAIGALTGTKRTASVLATEGCLVLALPKSKFGELIKSRPATVEKLIEDFSRTIVSLNDKVVDLTNTRV